MKMPVDALHSFFENIDLPAADREIARRLLTEITVRLRFLSDVGLGYLTLDRLSATLSGGESQRINLATQLGSSLVGSLYILDEPSIGLHSRDTDRLISVLKRLRDIGNTVVIVEHDEEIIREADHLIDVVAGSRTQWRTHRERGLAGVFARCRGQLYGRLSQRTDVDPCAGAPTPVARFYRGKGRQRTQSEEYRCEISARSRHCSDRSERKRQVDSGARCALSRACTAFRYSCGCSGSIRFARRRSAQGGGRGICRPESYRTVDTQQSGYLSQGLR